MNVKISRDRRTETDRQFDDMFNKMVRDAGLSARQRIIVQTYLRTLLRMRLHEVEAVIEMSYLLSLIEGEHYGTCPKRSTKLKRVQKRAAEHIDDAYGRGCINANGCYESYDGCGLERLVSRLANYGVEYQVKRSEETE